MCRCGVIVCTHIFVFQPVFMMCLMYVFAVCVFYYKHIQHTKTIHVFLTFFMCFEVIYIVWYVLLYMCVCVFIVFVLFLYVFIVFLLHIQTYKHTETKHFIVLICCVVFYEEGFAICLCVVFLCVYMFCKYNNTLTHKYNTT